MHRFIIFAGAIMLFFCLILAVIRSFGNTILPALPVALVPTDDCLLWQCLNGIRLGMSKDEAYQMLAIDTNNILGSEPGVPSVCWRKEKQADSGRNCYVENIYKGRASLSLDFSEIELRLGDLIGLFGPPSTAFKCGGGNITFTNIEHEAIIVASIEISTGQVRIEPDSKVSRLRLQSVDKTSISGLQKSPYPWRGFVQWNREWKDCGMG